MRYTTQLGNDFWYEFDDVFKNRPEAITAMLGFAPEGPMLPLNRYRKSRKEGTYPGWFEEEMRKYSRSLLDLARMQLDLIDTYFQGDADDERQAFEEFGQGILVDPRRPADPIHMMDVGKRPTQGFHIWHAFIRATVIVGGPADRWLTVDRNVGLAWAIHSELKPTQGAVPNPPMLGTRLRALRTTWTGMSADALDEQYDNYPYPTA